MMSETLAGEKLGQYEVQDLLDDNAIIQTYRAIQTSLHRPVAINVVRPEYRDGSDWQKALINGAEIAAKLEHPNIVPVIDYGVQGNIDYVVLRLMEGGILNKRIQEHPLPLREVATIIRQIANALDYVHSQGGYHGDPATINIIFDKTGNAYIAEFYLAGLLQHTGPEQPAGVPAFMAPERMMAQPPTALSDQYALAGVAYHVLTGAYPWVASARGRSSETIVLPQDHRAEIPESVNEVLLRALAREPADRFPTILDFARRLETVLQNVDQHIFISYSRRDGDYAHRLRTFFIDNDLPVWIDDEIEHGDQWFHQINEAIESCVAFVVIMSPDAEQSEWVHKEILLAKRYKKPIFPVLLSGDEFPILIDLQFADVRDQEPPDTDFYRRVARALHGN